MALTGTLVLAGCGSDEDKAGDPEDDKSARSAESAEKHNKADVTFASEMIKHHRQAVEMSEMAPDKAGSQEVKDLAKKIKKAQGPEINKMSDWLKGWGEKVPPKGAGMDHGGDGGDGGGHGGHGGGDEGGESGMPGMLTEKQLRELRNSSGKDFDKKFMTMMIEHHEGAVSMAETEREEGASGKAKKLAKQIIDAQESEIKEMHGMLGH
ncbi:hypothetical protein AN216_20680 [Streptomyces oceani]|uniref:DUF305 domain-containing protein n=1 Tax=Streptomyces oceani TaxID=1075402 RepID=A0A1E7JXN3_9ACTN|nr:hypothetical protein AN216_20680 [Streptomyces oceani]